MSFSPDMIRKAIGPHDGLLPADARRVVDIACLAVAADGTLAPEELDVIRALCKELDVDIRAVDEVLALGSRDDRLERLRTVGAGVSTTAAKHLAYRMTVLTALSDLAAADEEFEFDLDVQDALGLDGDEADRLTAEVNEALT